MRICLISDCYPPRVGGIETQVRSLAQTLQEAGHDVLVVTATGDRERRTMDGRVRVWRLATPLAAGLPVNPFAGRELRAAIAGADVVHIHHGVVSPFATHAAILAVRANTPTVVTWHCLLAALAPVYRYIVPVGYLRRRGAVLTAVSGLAARQLGRAAGAGVLVTPNGADLSVWSRVARRRAQPPADGRLRVVAATRLAPRKRPGVLARLARAVPGASITVFGRGPLRSALRGVEGLQLAGVVSQERLAEAYGGADVYVSVVQHESFGLAALEARAAGLVVVARRDSGVAEFITDGVDGLLADSDEEIIAAVHRLCDDRALLAALAAACRTPPPYDWTDVRGVVLDAYTRALGRRDLA